MYTAKYHTVLIRSSIYKHVATISVYIYIYIQCNHTSRAARGGGGSFKNRKRIGKIRCCESQLSERKHSPIVRRSNSLTISKLVSYLVSELVSWLVS